MCVCGGGGGGGVIDCVYPYFRSKLKEDYFLPVRK